MSEGIYVGPNDPPPELEGVELEQWLAADRERVRLELHLQIDLLFLGPPQPAKPLH
jgi:hypothetical protein